MKTTLVHGGHVQYRSSKIRDESVLSSNYFPDYMTKKLMENYWNLQEYLKYYIWDVLNDLMLDVTK